MYHSHAYGPWMNLRRHFDHAQAVGDFEQTSRLSGWSLLPMAWRVARRDLSFWRWLKRQGRLRVGLRWGSPALAWHFAALWGIWLGERKHRLAPSLVRRLSLQREYKTAVNMRILQVAHGYPPQEWGGAELVTATLARALAKRGHRVTVLARMAAPEAEEFSVRPDEADTGDGVHVVRIVNNLSQVSHFRLEYDNPFLNGAFHQVLTDTRPDVVHIQHVGHLSGSLLQVAAQLGYPVVLSLHDFFFACYRLHLIDNHTRLCPGPDRGERCVACLQSVTDADEARRRFAYFEQLLHIPQRVIVPSRFLADRMQEIFPFVEPRLRVVAPGIVPGRSAGRQEAQPGPLRVLYIGVLLPHKGAHLLVEATRGAPLGSIAVSLYGGRVAAWRAYADQLEADAAGLPVRFCGAPIRTISWTPFWPGTTCWWSPVSVRKPFRW